VVRTVAIFCVLLYSLQSASGGRPHIMSALGGDMLSCCKLPKNVAFVVLVVDAFDYSD